MECLNLSLIGYARVSTRTQTTDLQLDALRAAGVDRLYEDTASGSRQDRPGLVAALAEAQRGDVLVVWKLDRLGRSIRQVIDLVADLEARGVGFRSLTDGIDTSAPAGRFVLHILAALGEMERALIVERTRAGLAAARERGAKLGRKAALSPSQIDAARILLAQGQRARDVATTLKVSRSTLWRATRLT